MFFLTRYACILLRAVYQDALELGGGGASASSASNVSSTVEGGGGAKSSVEEAMQLFEVARFIEMDALVQSEWYFNSLCTYEN